MLGNLSILYWHNTAKTSALIWCTRTSGREQEEVDVNMRIVGNRKKWNCSSLLSGHALKNIDVQ